MIAVGPLQRLGSVFQGNTEQSRAEQYRAELTEPTELGSARSSTASNSLVEKMPFHMNHICNLLEHCELNQCVSSRSMLEKMPFHKLPA